MCIKYGRRATFESIKVRQSASHGATLKPRPKQIDSNAGAHQNLFAFTSRKNLIFDHIYQVPASRS